LPLIAILTVVLFLSVYVVPPSPEAHLRFPGMSDSQRFTERSLGS